MWWPFCCRSSCCRWRGPKREDFTMLSPQMHLFSFLADKNAILQMKAFNKQVDPVKQHFPHPRGGNKLQLQCCPAPPLINPRWLSDRSLGPPAAAHMQLTLGEQSWRQPRRTLHHLIEMKSVTPWPVFQHPHQHPPPLPPFGLSLQQQPSGEERQVLKHPQPRSCSVLMSPARSVRGELYSWLGLCCGTQPSCVQEYLRIPQLNRWSQAKQHFGDEQHQQNELFYSSALNPKAFSH